MPIRLPLCLILWSVLSLPALADLPAEIRSISEQLLLDGEGQLADGGKVYQPGLITPFYDSGGFQPAWHDREQIEEVLDLLRASELEGLDPRNYHLPELLELIEAYAQPWSKRHSIRARFDVLLTDGLLLYARHLLEGKVDPRVLDPSFNYARRDYQPAEVIAELRSAIAQGTVAEHVAAFAPSTSFYLQMKAALAYYRDLAAAESFRPIPENHLLKPGQFHANVVPLRRRLTETGYLDAGATESAEYDAEVEDAVRRFQRDHALDDDGVVGRQSFDLLNLSHAQRVDKLRINMDRLRWIAQDISDDFIVVNIAGFELYYMQNDEVVWETPVMIGTVAHQTPIFTARLHYVEFNPTWTVPRSIINRSLFGKFSANPQYVLDNDYHLYDRKGTATDPYSIDWSAYNGRNFPYRVVQQPGEKNALGRVKFIFPNRYAVYLHDTPSRELFARKARAFSSGCVRVKDPLVFAAVLLDDPQRWSQQQVESLVASREPQRRVQLERDIDVMLMYWTTSPTLGGKIQFHPDIYSKDEQALAALDAAPAVIGLAGG